MKIQIINLANSAEAEEGIARINMLMTEGYRICATHQDVTNGLAFLTVVLVQKKLLT